MEATPKFTILHRALHWIMALALPVLFITGFLRMYWMNKHHIVEVIASKTDLLSEEIMVDIAKTIRAPMWEWHVIFAQVIIAAFVIRIGYMIFKGIRFPNPFKRKLVLKERIQGSLYIFFYLFVFLSAFTGVSMRLDLFPELKHSIETVHKLGLYWFPIFVLLHLIGVLIAELTDKKGIVSKMIGGDKQLIKK